MKLGGLGIIIPSELSDIQYKNSFHIVKSLTENVVNQNQKLEVDVNDLERKKNKGSIEKLGRNASILEKLKSDLTWLSALYYLHVSQALRLHTSSGYLSTLKNVSNAERERSVWRS